MTEARNQTQEDSLPVPAHSKPVGLKYFFCPEEHCKQRKRLPLLAGLGTTVVGLGTGSGACGTAWEAPLKP